MPEEHQAIPEEMKTTEGGGRFMAIWNALRETLVSVLPVVIFLFAFNAFILRKPLQNPKETILGIVYTIIGLTIFIQGLNMGLLPLGTAVGENLTASANVWLVLVFSFIVGYGVTLAEPALQALGMQVEELSVGALSRNMVVHTVAFGVGIGMLVGMLKIMLGWSAAAVLIPAYVLAALLTYLAPNTITGIALDAGGVTTGPVTVPITMALGIGLATAIGGRDPLIDGFGLIALSSVGPIICLLALGLVFKF